MYTVNQGRNHASKVRGDEAPKALRPRRRRRRGGREWGGGFPLPSRLGGLGERRKLPQCRKRFWCLIIVPERLSLYSLSQVTFRKYVHGKDIALQTPGQPPPDQQHPAAPIVHTENRSIMRVNTAGWLHWIMPFVESDSTLFLTASRYFSEI